MSAMMTKVEVANELYRQLHPLKSASIESRWSEWVPWMTIECRKTIDPVATFSSLRSRHRSRMLSLFGAGITWKAIRNGRLDDPSITEDRFEFLLRAAIERRRARMGRVKGLRRKV